MPFDLSRAIAARLSAAGVLRHQPGTPQQLDYNLLYCWFVGLLPDDAVWDPATKSTSSSRPASLPSRAWIASRHSRRSRAPLTSCTTIGRREHKEKTLNPRVFSKLLRSINLPLRRRAGRREQDPGLSGTAAAFFGGGGSASSKAPPRIEGAFEAFAWEVAQLGIKSGYATSSLSARL